MDGATVNITEAAEILKVHPNRLYELIDAGDIPAARIGRAWVMMRDDVLKYVRQRIAHETKTRLCRPR